jgi:GDPmannose 4,6-dehydratase
MKKKAFITGINGQDGSYLAELLLDKGYEVHGLVRDQKTNILHLLDKITLHIGSANNQLFISKLICDIKPQEFYHLAASSFVSYDLDAETAILENNFNSTHYILATLKSTCPDCRFYFAGSSEMFGEALVFPQNENTTFNPRSIYGISKMAGAILNRNYRHTHHLFACNGILYNHESTRRSLAFVTRKITSAVAKIACGHLNEIELGNLEAKRDWGYAPEYVYAMWLMLNQSEPDDYVIATGQLHSVKELVQCAFACVNLDYQNYVTINAAYHRPQEAVPLTGDFTKARTKLGWQPEKSIFAVIEEMVSYDIQQIKKGSVS